MPDKITSSLSKLMMDDDENSTVDQNCFGLETSNNILKELDGQMSFQTMIDVGASFSFVIPLEKNADLLETMELGMG